MSQLTRRTQVLLDDVRHARLQRRAEETNQSIGALIREAIDVAYPERRMSRAEARAILRDAPRLDHGSPDDVKREIGSTYEKHL